MDANKLKSIYLRFTIPTDVDTPSETLLRMRDLCVMGLGYLQSKVRSPDGVLLTSEDMALIRAMLTES